ncbi:unnamed protein product [Ixodes hexagonus]
MYPALLLFMAVAATFATVRGYVPGISLVGETFGTAVLVGWGCHKLAGHLRRRLFGRILDSEGKAVLVTGSCDTGFGNLLTRKLAAKGYHVYAGCLFPNGEGAQDLKRISNVTVLQLDVTSEHDIDAAYDTVKMSHGRNVLWAVVSNAGTLSVGFIEWQSRKTIRAAFEVNVLGAVNVSQKFMPLLKRSRGRLLFVSSIVANFTGCQNFVAIIFLFTTEASTRQKIPEALHLEQRLARRSSLVRPSGVRALKKRKKIALLERMKADMKDIPREALGSFSVKDHAVFDIALDSSLGTALSDKLDDVIDTMVLAIEESHPRPVYNVGSVGQQIVVKIFQMLPEEWIDAIFATQWKFMEWRTSTPK